MTRVYESNGIDDRDIPTVTYRHDDDSVVVIGKLSDRSLLVLNSFFYAGLETP